MPKPPYTPDEVAFWRCPAHVMMALLYMLLGGMLVFAISLGTALVECLPLA
jgi:hypothetical protein